ncbi:MAG: DsbA family protein [Pikeienuella sp.]
MTTMNANRRQIIGGAAALAAASAMPATAQDALEDKGYALGDIVLGSDDAPVTVIEYASFTCPHCASFHIQSWPSVKRDYVDTGKARFIMREVYFDQFGLWASMIARCGGPERYYDVVDAVLKGQEQWYGAHRAAFTQTKNAGPIVNELMKIGRRVGMSNARMEECVTDVALRDRLVADFQEYSARDNIRSTPSFLINGELSSGAQSPAGMAALIDKHL